MYIYIHAYFLAAELPLKPQPSSITTKSYLCVRVACIYIYYKCENGYICIYILHVFICICVDDSCRDVCMYVRVAGATGPVTGNSHRPMTHMHREEISSYENISLIEKRRNRQRRISLLWEFLIYENFCQTGKGRNRERKENLSLGGILIGENFSDGLSRVSLREVLWEFLIGRNSYLRECLWRAL